MNPYLGKAFLNICRDGHLWIVSSDPAQCEDRILLLNVTTWRGKTGDDSSCLLVPQDHDSISHKSYINYRLGEVKGISYIRKMKNNECVVEKEDADERLIAKIHEGAKKTHFLKEKAVDLLEDQGFI